MPDPVKAQKGVHARMLVRRNIEAMEHGAEAVFGFMVGVGVLTKLVIPDLRNLRWPYVIFEYAGERHTEYVPSRKLFVELCMRMASPARGEAYILLKRNKTGWEVGFAPIRSGDGHILPPPDL